ncbi:hypothetical protein FJ938_22075 [Mesorhizobium sp. B2-4-14]|uniref:hypothetical protein n=1 Tax=Mesorhizobium sp. B2-4-14 TaxID=2589935 RepID=UPI001125FC50|nr:hypothetical protein [Mesorhizobium sp. B2-4-14]TPL00683.1 hypothetical protein FJ938_22075 [Mesorhizobium sp. B2-4-14]
MADQTSHTILTQGDKYYHEAKPSGGGVIPFANEPWRTEIQEAHKRDMALHQSVQEAQQRIKADGAPHILIALAGEDGETRAYLIGLIEQAGR